VIPGSWTSGDERQELYLEADRDRGRSHFCLLTIGGDDSMEASLLSSVPMAIDTGVFRPRVEASDGDVAVTFDDSAGGVLKFRFRTGDAPRVSLDGDLPRDLRSRTPGIDVRLPIRQSGGTKRR